MVFFYFSVIIPAKAFARDYVGGKASPSSFSVTISSRVWRLLSKNAVNRGFFFQCKQTNKSLDA